MPSATNNLGVEVDINGEAVGATKFLDVEEMLEVMLSDKKWERIALQAMELKEELESEQVVRRDDRAQEL